MQLLCDFQGKLLQPRIRFVLCKIFSPQKWDFFFKLCNVKVGNSDAAGKYQAKKSLIYSLKYSPWFSLQTIQLQHVTALRFPHCFVCRKIELKMMKPNIHSIDLLGDVGNVFMYSHNLENNFVV